MVQLVVGSASFEEGHRKRLASPAARPQVLRTDVRLSAEEFPRIATVQDPIEAFNDRAQFERSLDVIAEGAGATLRPGRVGRP